MIITITCNPAIDKSISGNTTTFDIGGKGINVSKVLKSLNVDSLASGFIGRENKDIVIDGLNKLDINHHFIEVNGKVRTNTKRIINNELFEENEKGPPISEEDTSRLTDYLKQFTNEIVTISGSCTSNIYGQLVRTLKANNNYVILDADKELLKDGIKEKPDCIKPNKNEICNLFGIEYDEELVIKKCRELNIDLICLSLGKDGALFISKDEVIKYNALDVDYHSSLGAGDAMVAGIAYSKLHSYSFLETTKLAMATSAAMCETDGSKAPTYEAIMDKRSKIK